MSPRPVTASELAAHLRAIVAARQAIRNALPNIGPDGRVDLQLALHHAITVAEWDLATWDLLSRAPGPAVIPSSPNRRTGANGA